MQIDSVYVGEIRLFAGNGAPEGWAFCNGQLLNIVHYPNLFAIIGTTYGGDGLTTFALPDLRGRMPIHYNHDIDGTVEEIYELGQMGGHAKISLGELQLPAHTHDAVTEVIQGNVDLSIKASNDNADLTNPTDAYPAIVTDSSALPVQFDTFTKKTANLVTMAKNSIGINLGSKKVTVSSSGTGAEFDIMPPYIAVNYIIALDGVMPQIEELIKPLLKSLSMSSLIFPKFNPRIRQYNMELPPFLSQVSIFATAIPSGTTIKANQNTVSGSGYTLAMPSKHGILPIDIDVISKSGVTERYSVNVYSGMPLLRHLAVDHGNLNEPISLASFEYDIILDSSITKTTLIPSASSLGDSIPIMIQINGVPVENNTAYEVDISNLRDRILTISLTKENLNTVYIFRIKRESLLSSLTIDHGTLSPVFSPATFQYSAEVDTNVDKLGIIPTTIDPLAEIFVNGLKVDSGSKTTVGLLFGLNIINIAINYISENIYSLKVERKIEQPLKQLQVIRSVDQSICKLRPVFSPLTGNYILELYNQTPIKVLAVSENSNSIVTINGEVVPNGSYSEEIQLNIGENSLLINVTSSDGVEQAQYHIKAYVTKRPFLTDMKVSSGVLQPNFQENILNYELLLCYDDVKSITVTPYSSNTTQQIKVNGNAVTSGNQSQSIPLNFPEKDFVTVATISPNGDSTLYTIKIIPVSPLPVPTITVCDAVYKGDGKAFVFGDSDVDGQIFFIIQTSITPDPDSHQVVNGLNGLGEIAKWRGSNTKSEIKGSIKFEVSGLEIGNYYVYMVAENTSGKMSDVRYVNLIVPN